MPEENPKEIFLEPAPFAPEGRQWCVDNVWPLNHEGDPGGIRYIRADLVENGGRMQQDCELSSEAVERLAEKLYHEEGRPRDWWAPFTNAPNHVRDQYLARAQRYLRVALDSDE